MTFVIGMFGIFTSTQMVGYIWKGGSLDKIRTGNLDNFEDSYQELH